MQRVLRKRGRASRLPLATCVSSPQFSRLPSRLRSRELPPETELVPGVDAGSRPAGDMNSRYFPVKSGKEANNGVHRWDEYERNSKAPIRAHSAGGGERQKLVPNFPLVRSAQGAGKVAQRTPIRQSVLR